MTYEWPVVEDPRKFMISNLDGLNSISTIIAASFFVEILSVRRPSLNSGQLAFVAKSIEMAREIAKNEDLIRATNKANKFGRDFRNDTTRLMIEYQAIRVKTSAFKESEEIVISNLQLDLERHMEALVNSSKTNQEELKLGVSLAAEYLILMEKGNYGNPQLPAVKITFITH